jgi:hypothetical protein
MPEIVFDIPEHYASAVQGAKADSAIQTVKFNGTALTPDADRAVNVVGQAPIKVGGIVKSTTTGTISKAVAGTDYASAAQGTKADNAIQGVKFNGTVLTPDENKIIDIPVSSYDQFLIDSGIMPPKGVLETHSDTGENIYALGPFKHVFYRAGDDTVPAADSDASGVPDYIEDRALQYLVTYHVFADVIGMRPPFLSPRHVGKNYQYIRVRYTTANGSTSLSYRAVQTDNNGVGYTPIAQAISASVYNPTPAHELLHQFQYGYSMFGNGWYLEGMARWSEDIISKIPYVIKSREALLSMLRVPAKWAELVALSYTASEHFWRPFGHCFESETQVILKPNDPYLKLKYHDGSYVIHDDWDFSGMRLLPLFFQKLEEETDRCYAEQGYAPAWQDTELGASVNNKYIRWVAEQMLIRM